MKVLKVLFTFIVFSILVALPSLVLGGTVETITGITESIPLDGVVVTGASILFAILADVFFRLYKSDKPRTILTFLAGLFGALGAMFYRARDLLVNISKYSDKFLPQRTNGDVGLIDKKP